MLHIVGTITPMTHVHQTDPNREGNLSRTVKTRVFDARGDTHRVPFVTANSVRGLLRRAAAEVTLDALDTAVSRALYSVLKTGKATRKDIGMQASVHSLVEGATNVFAGLFGGGGYMLHSRYTMGPLMPIVAWCDRFLHPSLREKAIPIEKLRYQREDGTYGDIPLVTELILTSRDDVLAGQGSSHIKDYQASVDAWIAEVTTGRVAKAKGKADKDEARKRGEKVSGNDKAVSVDVSGYNLIESILPGTPLQFWLRLKPSASDAQIGLMLLAVRDWANANVLGGASARGFGRFEAELALYDDDTLIAPSLFNLSDHATAYTLVKELGAYVEAATEALDKVTIKDLDVAFGTDKELLAA